MKFRPRASIFANAAAVVKAGFMLNALVAAAFSINVVTVSAQQPPSCTVAIGAIADTLPELVSAGAAYEWRKLLVTFDCNDDGSVNGATVQWRADAPGLLTDARSAISAIGARLTGDSATAVRGALERCMTLASMTRKTAEATASRTVITCTVSDASSVFVVQKRSDR